MKFSVPSLFKPDSKKGWTKEAIVRVALALLVVLGGTVLGLSLLGSMWMALTGERVYNGYGVSYNTSGYDEDEYYYGGVYMDEPAMAPAPAMATKGYAVMESSVAEYADSYYVPTMYQEDGGMYAEEFERTSYHAFFHTRLFKEICTAIAGLKPLDYVVFDYASESESYCSYEFRVEEAQAPTVAEAIRALNPKDFSADTSTVANAIDGQESQRAYLERRLKSLQATRTEAEDAYESLLEKAVTKGSVSELTNVVNSRLNTIERLTRDIQSVEEQLERLDTAQADTLEDTLYEHFSVQVQKRVYVDWDVLAQQWHNRVSNFVERANGAVLMVTFGFAAFLLESIVFLVFAVAITLGMVVVAKYMLAAVRYLWSRS